ncbi:hypothetical protein SOCE26_008990 [Sorangium cellulosum]|uniref:Uncharacterized protein n=1 Tax=Sorangium cellulosum TaxID=56 RepID=A0A2L0EJN8_SORCE|nr:hypothetical protein [Sorangium cellulosum]AUX39506.1 hypothetical protein SOCE26_008990 [Sorangium cellulosum]
MTHDAPEHDDLDLTGGEDPLLEACLNDALRPYLGALSPEALEDYRRFLTVFITTHPAAAPLYERLRARPSNLSRSADVAREGAAGAADAGAGAAPGDGTFGKRR